MKVVEITYNDDGEMVALTDDGNIFVRNNTSWNYIVGPSATDLPQITTTVSIGDVVDE